jgi:hypothetical protein
MFQVVVSVRGQVIPTTILLLHGLGKLKISRVLVRNRTRDHPAGSIVPQSTTLSTDSFLSKIVYYIPVEELTVRACISKNAVFWDVTPCGSCKNRRFEERIASTIRVKRITELGTTLAATCN